MKILVSVMVFASFTTSAVMRFDKQKFCCKKPKQQNQNMCTFQSFTSTTGCPAGYQPVIFPTNSNGQAYVNEGNCPHPDGTIAACEE